MRSLKTWGPPLSSRRPVQLGSPTLAVRGLAR
jgi:hypothetical protein